MLPRVRKGLGGNQRASPIVFTSCLFEGLFLGVAGSCHAPNASKGVWPALCYYQLVIHKLFSSSTGFKAILIRVLWLYWLAKPGGAHLQGKTFWAVDKLCLSLGQPVVSRLVPKNANPACPSLRIHTMGGKPLKSRLFQGAPKFHTLTQG